MLHFRATAKPCRWQRRPGGPNSSAASLLVRAISRQPRTLHRRAPCLMQRPPGAPNSSSAWTQPWRFMVQPATLQEVGLHGSMHLLRPRRCASWRAGRRPSATNLRILRHCSLPTCSAAAQLGTNPSKCFKAGNTDTFTSASSKSRLLRQAMTTPRSRWLSKSLDAALCGSEVSDSFQSSSVPHAQETSQLSCMAEGPRGGRLV
mmetsp:Transcript_25548/g.79671  ORF Transcript_25548/g.79671 Transcript_25548/m.79671 type:complete len:204 (+) Transcript_25548:351-962(+)